jgi:hypothetical protein
MSLPYRLIMAAGVALLSTLPLPAWAAEFTADVNAQAVANFEIGTSKTVFGQLEFVGGLVMVSSDRHFGALSSFRFIDGDAENAGTRFAAVADTGYFITGAIQRDADGKPIGMSPLSFTELRDLKGNISKAKWETDSESLIIEGDKAIIGFERVPRISVYAFDGTSVGEVIETIKQPIPRRELRGNQGFEAIALAPDNGPLGGAVVVLSEGSVDKAGNLLAAVTSGPRGGMFTVVRRDDFKITDADFLPSGNLLLLERSFSMATGVRMRLRQIAVDTIKPGAIVDGDILINASMAYQIDNMEGLDVWQAADGTTRLSMISDDNKSILQRNMYLEFVLRD